METLRLLYLAIGPGIAIAVYIYYSDKWEPEPKKLVIKGFLWGALAVFPSIYYEDTFERIFDLEATWSDPWKQRVFYAFFGVALAEEIFKFILLKEFIYDDPNFNEPFDGIVYGGMVGCGFATMENILYVLPLGYETGVLRLLTAVPAHAFDGVILGYFMGRAKFSSKPWKDLAQGLGAVILLHGIYDSVSMSHMAWSIYPILGIVATGIYLALKAKRQLEKHSKYVEFSPIKYTLLKSGKEQGPFLLREIRDSLARGTLGLDDEIFVGKRGQKVFVSHFLGSKIDLPHKRLAKTPQKGRSVSHVFIFYVLTFGFYLYFWFNHHYRDFRNYKNLDLDPEFRTLSLFLLTQIPLFVFGSLVGEFKALSIDGWGQVAFSFLVTAVEAAFLFNLFLTMNRYVCKSLKKSINIWFVTLVFFSLSFLRKFLPLSFSFYWLVYFLLILLQGGVLAWIQNNLNSYWDFETRKRVKAT